MFHGRRLQSWTESSKNRSGFLSVRWCVLTEARFSLRNNSLHLEDFWVEAGFWHPLRVCVFLKVGRCITGESVEDTKAALCPGHVMPVQKAQTMWSCLTECWVELTNAASPLRCEHDRVNDWEEKDTAPLKNEDIEEQVWTRRETKAIVCQMLRCRLRALLWFGPLLTLSLMVLWGVWLSSVESVCWNVEILQGHEAMAEVDQEHLRMCPRKLGYVLEWNRNAVEFHGCTRNNRLETDELLLELPWCYLITQLELNWNSFQVIEHSSSYSPRRWWVIVGYAGIWSNFFIFKELKAQVVISQQLWGKL